MIAIDARRVRWIVVGAAAIVAVGFSASAVTHSASPQAGAQAASPTQGAGRGAIQTPTGGRGPGAAPDAVDPANANADLSPKPPVVALTPAEQATRFWLPPGYRLEPVLADPLIDSPAQITFDGNGRMFVVELRGYEQTLDGVDSIAPVGSISRHEDRNNDGVFEQHTVFVDKLLFPRFAMPLGANSILTMETNADEVWQYTDTNGDGVADKKELFTTNFGRGGNLEAQQAGPLLGDGQLDVQHGQRVPHSLDADRNHPRADRAERRPVERHAGQRRQGVVSGRRQRHAGLLPVPDSLRQLRAVASEQFEPSLNITWGAPILIGDMQAGLRALRLPDGSLIHATASAGNDDLSRRPAAQGSSSAITSTANPSRASSAA